MMSPSGVYLINCLLLFLVVGLSVDSAGGDGRTRRSESDEKVIRYRRSEAAEAAVRDRRCVLSNRTVSVESNVTQYHCEMQEIRSGELVDGLLDALKMNHFPNSSTIESCRHKESMRRVLEQEGFYPDGTPKEEVSSAENDDDRECNRLNYQTDKNGCPGPACNRAAFTTHRILQSVRRDPTSAGADHYRTYFNLCNMTNYEIKNATLYFFVKQQDGSQSYTVHVYKYTVNGEIDTEPIVSENRSRPPSLSGDWDSVNLTELVRDWADAPQKNFGIMVKAEQKGPTANLRDPIERTDNQTGTHTIFLEIEVAEKEAVEYRRISRTEPNDCTLEPSEYNATCCRYSLEVDFEEFGWDWIIAPKRYNAYYCAGMCRRGSTNTQHATLIQHTQAQNMCCSPELMNEMKIIYLDDAGNVQTKVIKNMIVQRCGCS